MEYLKSIIFFAISIIPYSIFSQDFNEMKSAFAKSYTAEEKKKYSEAISAIKGVNTAKCYECELRLGWLYYLSGNNTESYAHYSLAHTYMPASTEALWGAVYPLTKSEKWVELAKVYAKILQNDPTDPTANYRLGLSYYYKKEYEKALKYFQIALDITPFDYNTMMSSAWTHYFLGHKNEAKILFQKVLLYNTEDASAKEGLSLIK